MIRFTSRCLSCWFHFVSEMSNDFKLSLISIFYTDRNICISWGTWNNTSVLRSSEETASMENQFAQHRNLFFLLKKNWKQKIPNNNKNNTNSKILLKTRWMKESGRYNALNAWNLSLFMFLCVWFFLKQGNKQRH